MMLRGPTGEWFLFFLAAIIPGKFDNNQIPFHPQIMDSKLSRQNVLCHFSVIQRSMGRLVKVSTFSPKVRAVGDAAFQFHLLFSNMKRL